MGYEIRVEIDEATERSLNELAGRLNIEAPVLGGNLLREQLKTANPSSSEPITQEERRARYWRIVAELEDLSRQAGTRAIPDEALTREALSTDHD